MYLEVLACFLLKQIYQSLHPQILLAYHQALNALGFGKAFQGAIASFKTFNDTSTNFLLENTGHFKDAYYFYLALMAQKFVSIRQEEAKLKENYVKGKIEDVVESYEAIDYEMNSVFTARYFSRFEFLKAIFTPDFYDLFFKDAWPAELPNAFGSSDYSAAIAEIQTIRILCHFLIIFNDYKKDGTSINLLQNDIEYYLTDILGSKNDSQMEESNIFGDPVIRQFMELINVYVKSVATVLSQTSEVSVQKILEDLPPVSKFQACVNGMFFTHLALFYLKKFVFLGVSAILHNCFQKKFNNVQRIRAMSDAVKMAQYMARLIAVTYEAIGKYLNVEDVKDFGKLEKYKAIFVRFAQYSVELKLLMEDMKSLAEKFIKHLFETLQPFLAKMEDNDSPVDNSEYFICIYFKNRFIEYKASVDSLIAHSQLSSLTQIGLLKPKGEV
uniref:Uncharacterized protein n=1 Tax=Panagrolaimus sp. ES5 TaxID=591445 RepID=A0AC34G0S4_9BILA